MELFMAVLRKSALFAPAFDKKLPRLLSRDYSSPNFSVQHLVKDMHLFLERARAMSLTTSSLEGVIPLLSGAIDRGFADVDYSAMFETVSPQPTPGWLTSIIHEVRDAIHESWAGCRDVCSGLGKDCARINRNRPPGCVGDVSRSMRVYHQWPSPAE